MVRRPVGLQIFVEGGGKGDESLIDCRKAFNRLIERAGFSGRMPRVIACGSRRQAFERFEQACAQGTHDSLLLVDSEGPVDQTSPWTHVRLRDGDGWSRPPDASDEDLHLMVECMEAWIVADIANLRVYYGPALQDNALPARPAENIPKRDLYVALDRATRQAGRYGKGKDAFKLLQAINPATLRASCPWAERFFAELDKRSSAVATRK